MSDSAVETVGVGGASARSAEDHRQRTLNLLLARLKEKLGALQTEHDLQAKKLSDLESSHARLQTAHLNGTAKAKLNDQQLNSKLESLAAAAKAEADQLNAKLVQVKAEAARSSSLMQSELQNEICTLQADLQVTQTALASSQQTLEADRTRLGAQLSQTQQELKESRIEAEQTLLELRREREERMRAQYAMGDKAKECDTHITRCKRLDERCLELSDQTQMARQAVANVEQSRETWRQKYIWQTRLRAEARAELKQYRLLLKYCAIATHASGFQMKRLLMAVHGRVVQLCAAAVTEPDVPPGTIPGSSAARIVITPSAATDATPGTAATSTATSAVQSPRHSRRGTMREINLAEKAAEFQQMRDHSEGTYTGATDHLAAPTAPAPAQPSPQVPSSAGLAAPRSSPPTASGSRVGAVVPPLGGTASGKASTTGNMGSLPRYSVGPIALSDREWAIHVAELARRNDPTINTKLTNMQLLHIIEDKLASLSTVVGELRSEVLTSRSTSEGMFQRTLQLSRKSMQVLAKLDREKIKSESLRVKLDESHYEAKRLRRFEYMAHRLADKDRGGPTQPTVSLKDAIALDRGQRAEDNYAAARGAGRRRRTTSALSDSAEIEPHDGSEERVLAGALGDDTYLDSSSEDEAREDAHEFHSSSPARVAARGHVAAASAPRATATPSQAPSALPWEARKIKEAILPSTSPSVAGPTSGSRSPARTPVTKFPSTSRPASHAGKGTATPPQQPLASSSLHWAGTPSPPMTASGRASKSASGARAIYVGSGPSTARELDEKEHEREPIAPTLDDESVGVYAPLVRRTRNPYSVSSSRQSGGDSSARTRRNEKSAASQQATRPASSSARVVRPPPTMHIVSQPRAPATVTSPAAPPRLHTISRPGGEPLHPPPSTQAILAAASASEMD